MSMFEKLVVAILVIAGLRAAFQALPSIVRVVGAVLSCYILVHWLAQGSWDIIVLLFSLGALAVVLFIVGKFSTGLVKARR